MGLLGAGDILGNGIYYHWYKGAYTDFTFSYYGFEWVTSLPEPLFSLYFIVGFALGIAVALGWRFRFTAPLFALAFTYLFLLEKAHYLNHAYLFVWLCWLLALTPAWREWSLDVRRRPRDWSPVVPAWSLYVFVLTMGLVYFWGGIAKINADWLLRAMPLKMWLAARADMPVLGPLWAREETAYVMAWGGMLLDLTVPFLLLHKRLRWLALAFLLFFHATNHLLFNIGIFPYLSMVLTSLFFAPDWPKRAVAMLAAPANWAGARVQRWREQWRRVTAAVSPTADFWQFRPRYVRPIVGGLALLIALHCFLPLRHWLFTGDVNWSEEGHRYSWRMMLRSKQGYGSYRLVDRATGTTETVRPQETLEPRQYRKMATHPDMILQYAHYLRDERAALGQDVAVYGEFFVRLNGRRRQRYVDPAVDLAGVEWCWFCHKDWVLAEEQ